MVARILDAGQQLVDEAKHRAAAQLVVEGVAAAVLRHRPRVPTSIASTRPSSASASPLPGMVAHHPVQCPRGPAHAACVRILVGQALPPSVRPVPLGSR